MTDMNSGDATLQINFASTKLNTKKKKKVHSNQPQGPVTPVDQKQPPPRAKQDMKYKLK